MSKYNTKRANDKQDKRDHIKRQSSNIKPPAEMFIIVKIVSLNPVGGVQQALKQHIHFLYFKKADDVTE